MYEGHFQLERRPFAATPDPSCCYLSPIQAPLFQSIGHCIDGGQGIAILTGPAGIGKTLLVQVLLGEAASRFTGVYLGTGQFPTRRALLQAILYELGQPYGGMTDQELRLELNTTLRNLITQRDGLMLVLDEAHLLSDRLLEEVRLLADLAQNGVPLTRIVLSGNPEFEERLTSPTLSAFHQRVACHVVLETLDRHESVEYLEHRIRWAGGDASRLFASTALELIARASDGVPRCLNQLADHALMRAFQSGSSTVTESIVREALAEVQHLSLRWNPSALSQPCRESATTATIDKFQIAPDPTLENPQPATVTAAIDLESDDNATACFEFGAGDAPCDSFKASVQTTIAEEPVSSTIERDDEDDGPPLFPWLAKPAETVQQVEDPFTASSFNIPARPRSRNVIEHEIVSTDTLTGDELLIKRRPETQRSELTRPLTVIRPQDLPAEEAVVDTYAQLDSHLTPRFPRPPATFPKVELVNIAKSVSAHLPSANDLVHAETSGTSSCHSDLVTDKPLVADQTDPIGRIDALCTLLERSSDTSHTSSQVELITDLGVERIDLDLPTQIKVPEGLAEHTIDYSIEALLGSTVIDVGREFSLKPVAPVPTPLPAKQTSDLESGLDRQVRYDIVEPELAGDTEGDLTPTPSVVPTPNHVYQNFFSMLRRRQAKSA